MSNRQLCLCNRPQVSSYKGHHIEEDLLWQKGEKPVQVPRESVEATVRLVSNKLSSLSPKLHYYFYLAITL